MLGVMIMQSKRLSIFAPSPPEGIDRKPLIREINSSMEREATQKQLNNALAELKKNEDTITLHMRNVSTQLAINSSALKQFGIPVEVIIEACNNIQRHTANLFAQLPEVFDIKAFDQLYNVIKSVEFIELMNFYRHYNRLYPTFSMQIADFLKSDAGKKLDKHAREILTNRLIKPVQHVTQYDLQLTTIDKHYQKCPLFGEKIKAKFSILIDTIKQMVNFVNITQQISISDAFFKDFSNTFLSPKGKRVSSLQPGMPVQQYYFLLERIKLIYPRDESEKDLLFIKKLLSDAIPNFPEVRVMNERINEIKHLRFLKVLDKVIDQRKVHSHPGCLSIFGVEDRVKNKELLSVLEHFKRFATANLKLSREEMIKQWLQQFANVNYVDPRDLLFRHSDQKSYTAFSQYYGEAFASASAPIVPISVMPVSMPKISSLN